MPPRLILMTLAPFDVAKSMALATSERKPDPSQSSAFNGKTRAIGAMPAIPTVGPPARVLLATIVPETCVPWPSSSVGVLGIEQPLLTGGERNTCSDGAFPAAYAH